MKKILHLLAMVLILTLLLPGTVSAYSGIGIPRYSEVPTEGRPAKDLSIGYGYLEENSLSADSTYLIAVTTTKLSKNNPNQITGTASTRAIYIVEEVSYDMVFQTWDGYNWAYFASIDKKANNAMQVSGIHMCNVLSKQYYRIKVTHRAKNGSDTTETITYSEYIYTD